MAAPEQPWIVRLGGTGQTGGPALGRRPLSGGAADPPSTAKTSAFQKRWLAHVERQGVKAGLEFARQRLVHRAMPRHPGKCRKLRGPDTHRIMRFPARLRPSVPMVKMAFIHYLKAAGGKCSRQGGTNSHRPACQFL
jgi:hypothetical protein